MDECYYCGGALCGCEIHTEEGLGLPLLGSDGLGEMAGVVAMPAVEVVVVGLGLTPSLFLRPSLSSMFLSFLLSVVTTESHYYMG